MPYVEQPKRRSDIECLAVAHKSRQHTLLERKTREGQENMSHLASGVKLAFLLLVLQFNA